MSRVVVVELTARAGCESLARSLIVQNAAASLEHEPGCLRFDVAVDPDNPACFTLYEIYQDASDFEAHLKMPHYLEFDAMTKDVFSAKTVRLLDLMAGQP